MSRLFSTSSHLAKKLNWKINPTVPVPWVVDIVEAALDRVDPALAAKIDSAAISGDSHATGSDPWHVNIVAGKKDIKGKNRITSAHVYPDGKVKFSDKRFGEIDVGTDGSNTGATGNGSGAAGNVSGASGKALEPAAGLAKSPAQPEWVWDAAEKKHKYWNGSQWIWH